MRVTSVLSFLFLCSCAAPGVSHWGGESGEAVHGGHRFRVNFNRDTAEAYRMSAAFKLRRAEVFEAAALAMEEVTGCRVPRAKLVGDVARVTAPLIC